MAKLSPEDIEKMGLELIPGTTDQYRKKKKEPVEKKINIRKENFLEPGKSIKFFWFDKSISLNKWYSSEHWSIRNATKNEWHNFFKQMLPKEKFKINKYVIALEYNGKLDPSNTITMIKLCEDLLREEKIIDNDTKDFCKGVYIIPRDDYKKNQYRITVKAI